MKHTSCCHATYTIGQKKEGFGIFTGNICDKCHKPCTLEDILVHTEGWEERFRKQFWNENINDSSSPIHSRYMNGGIGRFVSDVGDFIKSERELLVEKMETLFYNMVEDAAVSGHLSMEYLKDIKMLIQDNGIKKE